MQQYGNRRRFMKNCLAGGFTLHAVNGLISNGLWADDLDAKKPVLHHTPKAKHVIVLFANGGPSQVDTFDPKPELTRADGKSGLMGSPFKFKPYGQSGIEVSELFPQVGSWMDEICLIRSMHGTASEHVGACQRFFCGSSNLGGSLGAWALFGSGSDNSALPGFVMINGRGSIEPLSPRMWSAGPLPPLYQGTPVVDLKRPVKFIQSELYSNAQQKRVLDAAQQLNRMHLETRETVGGDLSARISAFEMAYRMQAEAPKAFDFAQEPDAIKEAYGLKNPITQSFGEKCLLARRLVERGVRFVVVPQDRVPSISKPGGHYSWDAHAQDGLLEGHPLLAKNSDGPAAALLADLKQRGLLKDTLVIWSGEMGRTVTREGDGGRNHNANAFSLWIAGGGIKGGYVHGATDELGGVAADKRVHIDDLHVTVLHALGVDHKKLEYKGIKLNQNANVVNEVFA